MKKLNQLFLLLIIFSLYSCNPNTTKSWTLNSPSGNIELEISLHNEGTDSSNLSYTIYCLNEKERTGYLKNSNLGINTSLGSTQDALIFNTMEEPTIRTEEYTMISGKRKENTAIYKKSRLSFTMADSLELELHLKLFDEGVAFAYSLSSDALNAEAMINSESTSFRLDQDAVAWMQPYDTLKTWSPSYEYGYEFEIPVGTLPPYETGWGFPVLFRQDSTWIFISEAGLYNYTGAHLGADCQDGNYKIEYAQAWENYGYGKDHPEVQLPWQSPWRFILIDRSLATIVESNMVHHLSEPTKYDDISWIKPGISSWSWWSDHESSKDYDKLKKYVDLAADMGWPYSLVDAGWHIMENGNLKQLAEYADSRNVELLLWYNSGGPHTRVMDAGPRDLVFDPEIRKAEFKRIADLGIKGIKVDFFQGEKQEIIKLYEDIARDAAAEGILVNTHGCTIPRGWARTYPNFLTMEAVRGGEIYSLKGWGKDAPAHNAVYPFTRNVIGSMDYTPVMFSDYLPGEEYQHLTTNAHELALAVLFESGIQHFADRAESYMAQPREVIEFLKKVPVTWDDTRFIDGYPGEYAVLARKKDNDWYIAGINALDTKVNLSFNPEFIAEGNYKAQIFTEGESDREFSISDLIFDAPGSFKMEMAPMGGFLITIRDND